MDAHPNQYGMIPRKRPSERGTGERANLDTLSRGKYPRNVLCREKKPILVNLGIYSRAEDIYLEHTARYIVEKLVLWVEKMVLQG